MGAQTAITRRYTANEIKQSTYDQIQKCNEDRLNLTIAAVGVSRMSQSCNDIANSASSSSVDGFERESVSSYASKPAADLISWSFDGHSETGSYVHFFKQHRRNLVVGWARQSSIFPLTEKFNEFAGAVLRSVTNYKVNARESTDKAYAVANSYGYPIVFVHVVCFGNGLRSHYNGYTSFQNFKVGSLETSVVIMFGNN
ncbi:uncharacterized protein LOC136091467 [Hydra vulgaris]|uniref:Uncharacterized protein LOC136091467 n=1 Tax=Hydra vulgaris TaxID=6087 RepID=A0ABM4DKU0_HYDVU